MVRWRAVGETLPLALRNRSLWLLQFLGNALIFGALVLWLHTEEKNWWSLVLNLLLMAFIAVGVLVLHGGTLNYSSGTQENGAAPLRPAFKKALKHLPAIAVWAVVVFFFWRLIDSLEAYQYELPGYLRSEMPLWIRRHIGKDTPFVVYGGMIVLLRWVVLPGLMLPLAAFCAAAGFRGLVSLRAWGRTVADWRYWLVVVFAAFLGVYCVGKVMGWRPGGEQPLLAEEISLAIRLLLAYLLGLFAWLGLCSRLGGVKAGGQPIAQPQQHGLPPVLID